MKKRFFVLLLCMVLIAVSFCFVGCGDKNYTKEDIDSLYSSMKTNESTSQFFDGNYFKVTFGSQIDTSSSDKSYIFPAIYDCYLASSSGLLSGVVDRVGKMSYAVKNFSTPQLNDIYKKLSLVNSSLIKFANNKAIFETTNGNLHYKYVVSSYNDLIKSMYSLNDSFANYYFVDNVGKVDFSKTSLSDSNVRDMLRYQLLKLSRVSFNFEVLNFVASNPLSDINDWLNSTSTIKNFVTNANTTLNRLSNTENLASHIGSNASKVLEYFVNMQVQENEYNREYNSFIVSVQNFNVKAYTASTNKYAYLENCSYQQQSNFNIIKNFLLGRYTSYIVALTNINSYV